MREAVDKLGVSIINALIVIVATFPFLLFFGFDLRYRIVVGVAFFLYQIIIALTPSKRSVGMIVLKSEWSKRYSLANHLTFAVLYSLSFATALIWLFFPFDLLILNLIVVQLPMVLTTGYTLHGYLSGQMVGHRLRQ